MANFKVFIAESNAPRDFYDGRNDGFAANELLKVRRIPSRYRAVLNKQMLELSIREAEKNKIDVFHLSCHGNDEGVQLTDGTFLPWDEVADVFQPLASEDRILVNSACEGGNRGVAQAFRKAKNQFGYICGSRNPTISFHDSCLAWSILYNVFANEDSVSPPTLRNGIDKINKVLNGDFAYRRWRSDKHSYTFYPGIKS